MNTKHPFSMDFRNSHGGVRSVPGAVMAAILFAAALGLATPSPAAAWDEDGHAIVTFLALDALPPDMPDWLKTPEARERIVYLSSEPDRWRGQHNPTLDHINNPDHYIDEELLQRFGVSLKALPPLRLQLTDLIAVKCAEDPKKYAVSDEDDGKPDKAYTRRLPGLLPYRISELQWKIAAEWTQLKTYEAHPEKVSAAMIRNARENIIYSMGILSHYVGDGSQPLHLTLHHHGWVGPNPKGYTTSRNFHEFVDGGVFLLHNICYDEMKPRAKSARKMSTNDYMRDICDYLLETFQQVEPLYELEKSGDLKRAKGKFFIEDRLLEGGSALAGIWVAAFKAAHIDQFRVDRLNERFPHEPGRRFTPSATTQPTSH